MGSGQIDQMIRGVGVLAMGVIEAQQGAGSQVTMEEAKGGRDFFSSRRTGSNRERRFHMNF